MPKTAEKIAVRIAKFTIVFIGILVALSFLGINLTELIVGLGALSIALSFALSTLLENLVSGLLVHTDKEILIGDRIQIKNYEGIVVKLNIRTTVLETEQGDFIFVPNSLFINNPALRRKRMEH